MKQRWYVVLFFTLLCSSASGAPVTEVTSRAELSKSADIKAANGRWRKATKWKGPDGVTHTLRTHVDDDGEAEDLWITLVDEHRDVIESEAVDLDATQAEGAVAVLPDGRVLFRARYSMSGLAHQHVYTLAWDARTKALETVAHVHLAEKRTHGRPSNRR